MPIEKVAEVYAKKGGNKSATAKALQISRTTLDTWRKENQELDMAMSEVEESLIDFSESKLIEQINAGNLTAIIFYLKTKGKKRGYVEKNEQDLSIDSVQPINITVVQDDGCQS